VVPLPANGSITSPSGGVTSRTSQRIKANGLIVGCLEPLRSALLESHMGRPGFRIYSAGQARAGGVTDTARGDVSHSASSRVPDRSFELAHREITASSIDLVVEVPVAVHVGFQDLATEDVLHNRHRNRWGQRRL
jgi:hypothetical protein